ncbi:hypothetical protein SAMD00019534_023040 [Acytostelium subglobosum LB1]|uniref:hypothetical protein n=1 Tax=Acytostelium subglobosum LB1 TaxID=1410327 RepID=UPI00064491C1|nr:hypothetical protein SAMD00019534_023040 [Acytostelium subglobosum LB1]GAM19129.1 hypothetical protein SAMD00019534_023040 [Acytostelium subglobosum LB1]|eukprot:XP_012757056.1 hypothetical protein SAMD00019534_023040 [Acytostelium subglobosum LB1]
MLKYNATQMFIDTFDALQSQSISSKVSLTSDLKKRFLSRLLLKTIKYNNAQAFNHLLKQQCTDGILPLFDNHNEHKARWTSYLIKHGNVELLTAYLVMHTHCKMSTSYIMPAIDTGNVQFVRLLLQHNMFQRRELYDARTPYQFKRLGVSIDMLKLLHEEFNILYKYDERVMLWSRLLGQSIKSSKVDSVQYILKHMGYNASLEMSTLEFVLSQHRENIGMNGSIDLYDALCADTNCAKVLFQMHFGLEHILRMAAAHGHSDLIKHIYTSYCQHNPEKRTYIHDMFEDGEAMSRLRMAPLVLILNDDLDVAESMIDQLCPAINLKLWSTMSERMAMHLTKARHHPLKFNQLHLIDIIDALSQPGSKITEEIIHRFIDNCSIETSQRYYGDDIDDVRFALTKAPSVSPSFVQHLRHAFNLHYPVTTDFEDGMMLRALEMADFDQLSIAFQLLDRPGIELMMSNDIRKKKIVVAASKLISHSSLDVVTLMLDNLPVFKLDPHICEWAVSNTNVDVIQYVLGLFHFDVEPSISIDIDNIINLAYIGNNAHIIIPALKHRFEHELGKTLPRVHLATLNQAATKNAHHSLEYHFGSSEFQSMSESNRLSTLHSILNSAYDQGYFTIVKRCTTMIDEIQSINQSLLINSIVGTIPSFNHSQ